ncbi:3-phosphoshikimate 1-carboxyvinyltransferase [Candidatus Woesearchaeota archaeon]|nr:3-phosphoshikimate 1-carboxyvinyltransferase [Candidatus Woesearchaeota archaeon]
MLAIKTKKFVNATIEAPPSKSYTQRALVIAALAKGKSVIKNPLFSDDTYYMIQALKNFGVKIWRNGSNIVINGANGMLKQPKSIIYVGNAGTAMRFLATIAAVSEGETTITGDKRMQQRPIQDLLDALGSLGVRCESNKGFPPIKIYGGSFNGGSIKLSGGTSSQYLSSILMCAPYANKNVTINLNGKLASEPYVDITIDAMKKFGVNAKCINHKKFIVKNSKKYKAKNYKIEGDATNASYFFAAAAVTKGKIMVKNINPNSKQGDIKFVGVLKRMGCGVKRGKNFIQVEGHSLKSIDVDMNEMPDIVPTLAVASLFADSTTVIRNAPNLRLKETDRLKALAFELRKIGANVEELQDGLRIKRRRLQKAIIETYNDHRIAMSFAVAGLAINGIRIKNPACVSKSFPDFWKKFNEMCKK